MNPYKGDVPLEVGGNAYTLRFNHLALIKLEKLLGKGLAEILGEISDPAKTRLTNVVALLWAGLQKHHPEITEDQVIELLDEIDGGAPAAMSVVGDAMAKAFNAPGTKGTNPPQRGNGTGTQSLSSTSASPITPTPSGT